MRENLCKWKWLFFVVLCVACAFVLYAVISTELRKGILTVAFLDVRQGDAIFIESPTGVQVLIDGGKDNSVLRELSNVMPFYDRNIDVVIATHPDADHIGGLIPVLERYDVGQILHSGVEHDTPAANLFSDLIERHRMSFYTKEVLSRRGQVLDLGGGAYLRVLFPDRDASLFEPNTASLLLQLVYGEHKFLFTGDSPSKIEEYLVSLDGFTSFTTSGNTLKSDVLKLGHHGSNTSSSDMLLGFVAPEYAIISAAVNNRYGHPHTEVLDKLEKFEIKTLSTSEHGTILFESDGEMLRYSD